MLLPAGWDKLFHVLANIVLVSIPEESFVIMFTLILLNQFDFLESRKDGENRFKKIDIARIGIIVCLVAIISNIFRFYLNFDPSLGFFILVLSICIAIIIIYELYWNIIDVFKTFVFVIISCMTLLGIEMLYVPVVLYSINKTVQEINNSLLLNFIISLPERVIEFLIIVYTLHKKAAFVKGNVFKTIIQSRFLMLLSIIILLINMGLLSAMVVLIVFERILINYSLLVQLGITVLVVLFPIINITSFLAVLIFKDNVEAEDRFIIRQDLEATLKDMKRFTKYGRHDKVSKLLSDLEIDIKRIYKNYEKEVRL